MAGGKYFVTGGTDKSVRVYICIPGPPVLQAEIQAHTVRRERGKERLTVQEVGRGVKGKPREASLLLPPPQLPTL